MKTAGVELVELEMPGLAELNAKVSFPVALYEANVDLANTCAATACRST